MGVSNYSISRCVNSVGYSILWQLLYCNFSYSKMVISDIIILFTIWWFIFQAYRSPQRWPAIFVSVMKRENDQGSAWKPISKSTEKVFPPFWRLIKYSYRSARQCPIKTDQSKSIKFSELRIVAGLTYTILLKKRKTYFTSLNKSDKFPVLKKNLTAWRSWYSLKTIFIFVVRNANDWKEVIELLGTRFFWKIEFGQNF